jgi:hypothetical protein
VKMAMRSGIMNGFGLRARIDNFTVGKHAREKGFSTHRALSSGGGPHRSPLRDHSAGDNSGPPGSLRRAGLHEPAFERAGALPQHVAAEHGFGI